MRHPIPDAALKKHIAILGMNGSGKTSVAKSQIIEPALEAGERVCNIDPTGVGWGLRLGSDGKRKGFAIYIVGGDHADFPLFRRDAKAWGEIVGTSSDSYVFDTSQMTVEDRSQWFTDFAETLIRKNKGPLKLVLDEAHLFAPQAGARSGGIAPRMLHATNNLLALGRSKGLIITMISQRPAKLHKDSLTQAHTLIAMALMAPQDRGAVKDWIADQADAEHGKDIIASLPTLKPGEAWIWAPKEGVLDRVTFGRPRTFDSSSAPSDADGAAVQLSPINPDAIKARLAEVAKETVASDPKALRAEIARLNAELQNALKNITQNIPADPKAIEAAEERGFERAKKQLTAAAERHVREAHLNILQVLGERLAPAMSLLSGEIRKIKGTKPALSEAVTYSPAPAARVPRPAPSVPPRSPSRAKPSTPIADGEITGPQRQLLQALAWWKAMGHERPTRVQVASICGWRITSGHLKNVSGSLRTRGLIDYPSDGTMAMTEEGEALAPAPDMSTTLEESVREILTGPQRQVFDLLPADGSAMTREEITRGCGWEPASGHIKNVLGSMRSLEIIDYPARGEVARAEWLRAERVAA